MSRPMADIPKKSRRPRRQFDQDFKAQAVRLVLGERRTAGAVARDSDSTEPTLRTWVKQAKADRPHGRPGLTTAERDELARLRKIKSGAAGRAGDLKKFSWAVAHP